LEKYDFVNFNAKSTIFKHMFRNLLSMCCSQARNREIRQECGFTQQHPSCLKGCVWAILGGLGWPIGITTNSPQTKPDRIILRHVAQFAITRVWRFGTQPRHSKCVTQVSGFVKLTIVHAQSTILSYLNFVNLILSSG
jgi:hypothetical protein